MAAAIPVTLNAVNKAVLDDYINGKSYKVYLSTDTIVSSDSNISDLTEIAAGNGYTAGGPSVSVTSTRLDNAAYLVAPQPTITASGGDIGPYTGIAIYETATGKLVAAYNEVSPVTIVSGSSKTLQFNQLAGFLHWGSVEP